MLKTTVSGRLSECVKKGLQKGWHGYVWILKLIVPLSFLTFCLDFSGLLVKAEVVFGPLMGLLALPPEAALPIIIGLLVGIYGGIAAMAVLPFSVEQMTLIAVFLLISHNLIQESTIQGKSGIHPLGVTLLRLLAAVLCVMVVAQFLDDTSEQVAALNALVTEKSAFGIAVAEWGRSIIWLGFKMLCIIMAVMIVLELLKGYHLIPYIVRALRPVLALVGLNTSVGVIWLTACLFGVAYGATVIIEEVNEGQLTQEELSRIHFSIGINHAMIEDPALFLPFGISPFWLWIPRLLTAIIFVHLLNLYYSAKRNGLGFYKS
jgi:hypothetical protein